MDRFSQSLGLRGGFHPSCFEQFDGMAPIAVIDDRVASEDGPQFSNCQWPSRRTLRRQRDEADAPRYA